MTNALLNIAGKIDPQTVALFEMVSSVIADLDMPYIVVGATARDIVLHYGHGARVQRAIQDVIDALYAGDNTQIMERYAWDITQAAAHLLGQHAKRIAQANTQREIARLANGELGELDLERLAEEMCEYIDVQYDRNQQLLSAFMAGFIE